ncbi:MAG: hypothetical protein HY778_03210 [Betaproteobacteria bacterium]|nr:hypothetical protein [Betaproteobacteria bacterium]
MLRLSDYPQLRLLAWNRRDDDTIDEREALALYEANWRFVEPQHLTAAERELLDRLVREFGAGVLHV